MASYVSSQFDDAPTDDSIARTVNLWHKLEGRIICLTH